MNQVFKGFSKYVCFSVISMLFFSLGGLVDVFVISKMMGNDGLTTLNLILPIFTAIAGLSFLLGIGGSARYSILKAEGKDDEANQVFSHTLISGIVIGAICVLMGVFLSPQIASLLGARGNILSLVTISLRPILIFSPLIIVNNIFVSFIRNDGAPKIAMFILLLMSVLNVTMDYLLIVVFDLGMLGFALMVGVVNGGGLICSLIYWLRKKTNFQFVKSKFQWKQIQSICGMGGSALISELSSGMVIMVFNFFILRLEGNTGVAAFGIITNLALISIAVFTAVGQGIQPLVSTYYGKKDQSSLDKVLIYSLVTAIVLPTLVYVGAYLFTDQLVAVFNQDQDPYLAELASHGLRLYFFGVIFVSVNVVITAFLSADNAPRAAIFVSILRGGLVMLPIIFVMAHLFDITGVWLSYPKSEFIVLLIASFCLWRVRRYQSTAFENC